MKRNSPDSTYNVVGSINVNSHITNKSDILNILKKSECWQNFLTDMSSYIYKREANHVASYAKKNKELIPYMKYAFEQGFKEIYNARQKGSDLFKVSAEDILNSDYYGFKVKDLVYLFLIESNSFFSKSHVGAKGPYQFMDNIWISLNNNSKHYKLPTYSLAYHYDPIVSARMAGRLLADNMFVLQTSDPLVASITYNGGPKRLRIPNIDEKRYYKGYPQYFNNYLKKQKNLNKENLFYPARFIAAIKAVKEKATDIYNSKPIPFKEKPIKFNIKSKFYIVKKGDSLYSIANKFGTSLSHLKALNNIRYSRLIKPGQKIYISKQISIDKSLLKDLKLKENKLRSPIVDKGYPIVLIYPLSTTSINKNSKTKPFLEKVGTYSKKFFKQIHSIFSRHSENKDLNRTNISTKPSTKSIPKRISYIDKKNVVHHFVNIGETLYSISKNYGVSIDMIKRYNHLVSEIIFYKQELKIPLTKRYKQVAIVRRGDNLYNIKQKYGQEAFVLGGSERIIKPGQPIYVLENIANALSNKRSFYYVKNNITHVVHYVKRGDTIFNLRRLYSISGVKVVIPSKRSLRVGDQLLIKIYKPLKLIGEVKKGDSLFSIRKRYPNAIVVGVHGSEKRPIFYPGQKILAP